MTDPFKDHKDWLPPDAPESEPEPGFEAEVPGEFTLLPGEASLVILDHGEEPASDEPPLDFETEN